MLLPYLIQRIIGISMKDVLSQQENMILNKNVIQTQKTNF
jgi:hypothetical protein